MTSSGRCYLDKRGRIAGHRPVGAGDTAAIRLCPRGGEARPGAHQHASRSTAGPTASLPVVIHQPVFSNPVSSQPLVRTAPLKVFFVGKADGTDFRPVNGSAMDCEYVGLEC